MTYQEHLQQLLQTSIQKSKALIDVVSEEGQSHSLRYKLAHADWETAEANYSACLDS